MSQVCIANKNNYRETDTKTDVSLIYEPPYKCLIGKYSDLCLKMCLWRCALTSDHVANTTFT